MAASYRLQVSTSAQFTTTVYDSSNITGTSNQVIGLSSSTTYYWRVNARNSYGTLDLSTVWPFTTIIVNVLCPGIPTINYAGKTYNTVRIGDQCWLKENLDIGVMINGGQNQTDNDTIEKYCYNNDTNYCNTYGGFYLWNEAMQHVTTPAKGICPTGWHVPTEDEFNSLSYAVGRSNQVLRRIDWRGTNTSGFSAMLVGYWAGGSLEITTPSFGVPRRAMHKMHMLSGLAPIVVKSSSPPNGRKTDLVFVASRIKQNLKIKSFYGNSANAFKTQFSIAISVYSFLLLLRKN